MRDKGVFSIRRALPRMSWSPKNLYNLWTRTMGPKADDLKFRVTHATSLFQQRWKSKALVRAYHGDFIPEKIFKRWYLPETLPDVRPRRKIASATDDKEALQAFAQRKQRETFFEKEIETKGMAPVGSLMFSEVERRIDVFVFRCCFTHSVYEARRLVIHGDVMLNGKKHTNANTRLAPGDMVSVNPSAIRFLKELEGEHDDITGRLTPTQDEQLASEDPEASSDQPPEARNGIPSEAKEGPKVQSSGITRQLTPFRLPPYASPWLFIPAYIEPSFSTCSAVYVRHPTARPGYSEIPTPYDADGALVRYAWEWYVQRRPRVRSKAQLARMPEDRARLTTEEDITAGRRNFRDEITRFRRAVKA